MAFEQLMAESVKKQEKKKEKEKEKDPKEPSSSKHHFGHNHASTSTPS
jgi:hypothetical protein